VVGGGGNGQGRRSADSSPAEGASGSGAVSCTVTPATISVREEKREIRYQHIELREDRDPFDAQV